MKIRKTVVLELGPEEVHNLSGLLELSRIYIAEQKKQYISDKAKGPLRSVLIEDVTTCKLQDLELFLQDLFEAL